MNHQHIFKQGNPERPLLLLLHGTGGTEHDLFFLGEAIDPEASLLGVRGNVTESGMNRYFRRLAEGVFDENDLDYRTKELIAFLEEASKEYGFDRNNIVAIGYSNGANIAGSMIYSFKDVVKGAILHHPMCRSAIVNCLICIPFLSLSVRAQMIRFAHRKKARN